MKVTLHKHVVTKGKVAFMNAHKPEQEGVHPHFYTLPKYVWLEMDRPETITVEVL